MLNVDGVFGANDDQVNGDILVHISKRVVYADVATQTVMIPHGWATIERPGGFEPRPITRRECAAFLILNTDALRNADNTIPINECATIAYYRFLAYKYRLCDPGYDVRAFNVDYNQCRLTLVAAQTVDNLLADTDDGLPQVRKRAASAAITASLTQVNRTRINTVFNNVVCLMAYMFRTRGHHYMDEFLAKYERLYSKTVTSANPVGISWKYLATNALHAIIPSILDAYWLRCVATSTCDDILKLRINSAAAGTAAFTAIRTGMKDLFNVMPMIRARVAEAADYVEQVCDRLAANRWDHSINARFYGANQDRLDEGPIAVIAAMIRATLDSIAAGAPLIESQSLARAATNAPISGAIFSSIIRNVVRTEKFMMLMIDTGLPARVVPQQPQ